MYVYTTYTRPLSVQAQYSRKCPIISIALYNGSLVTWTVVCLTTAKFKPLIFLNDFRITTGLIQSRGRFIENIRCPAMDICEPHRKQIFFYCCIYSALHYNGSYPNVACIFFAADKCLPSRCPSTGLQVTIYTKLNLLLSQTVLLFISPKTLFSYVESHATYS
jgi:hypothetical protein